MALVSKFQYFHFAVFAIKFKREDGAVLQTKIAGLIVHWIDLSATTELVENAILAGHKVAIGRFAIRRRVAYWILDARWAIG